ncbi:MAG: FAD-binding oxidoreductase [Burkholderiaceae bacterium]
MVSIIHPKAESVITARRSIEEAHAGSLKPEAHEPSYWAATTDIPDPSGPLIGDLDTDVAIIGGGYTGLSTAYHLAKNHGIRACVLEANRVGWGCSGRNGGFAMIGVGKDGYSGWIQRLGLEEARRTFEFGRDAVRTLRGVLQDNQIDAASPNEGYLYLAHKSNRIRELKDTQRTLKDKFSFDTTLLGADEVKSNYLSGTQIHGALLYPEHFPIHPMRYVQGLAKAVRDFDVKVHEGSRVVEWTKAGARHVLRTPQGNVRANRVVIATNGYTPDDLHSSVSGRMMNVLSNIIVTEPLTPWQRDATNWRTHQMLVDTRMLRFYFRLLEDNRIMFGARGGITDSPKSDARMRQWLLEQLTTQFPGLDGIRDEYFWRGWVSIARDKSPHLGTSDDGTVSYGLAYAGTGVAAATHSGKLIARSLATDAPLSQLPLVGTPLPRFEVPALRKWYQRAAYTYYYLKDEYL